MADQDTPFMKLQPLATEVNCWSILQECRQKCSLAHLATLTMRGRRDERSRMHKIRGSLLRLTLDRTSLRANQEQACSVSMRLV